MQAPRGLLSWSLTSPVSLLPHQERSPRHTPLRPPGARNRSASRARTLDSCAGHSVHVQDIPEGETGNSAGVTRWDGFSSARAGARRHSGTLQLGAFSLPYLSTLQPHFRQVQPPNIASSDDVG